MANDMQLAKAANNIRILAASMVEKAKSGHPGGAMGGADFVNVLFAEFLRYDPDNMLYPHRDRFFLDPGHMSPMLYSVLSLAGHYTTITLGLQIRILSFLYAVTSISYDSYGTPSGIENDIFSALCKLGGSYT